MIKVNIAPMCKVKFSSTTCFSTEFDEDYLLRRKIKQGKWRDFSFHTKDEPNPYIIISLPKVIEICEIRITNRNQCAYKADTLTLEAFNQDESIFQYHNTTNNFKTIELNKNISTSKLKVYLTKKSNFHLRFVEIFIKIEHIEDLDIQIPRELIEQTLNDLGSDFLCQVSAKDTIQFYNTKHVDKALYEINSKNSVLNYNIRISNIQESLNKYYLKYLLKLSQNNNIPVEFFNNNITYRLENSRNFSSFNIAKFHKSLYCPLNMLLFCLSNFIEDNSIQNNIHNKHIIIDTDSSAHWGFADRLRGALYLYKIFKDKGFDPYIKFTKPFALNKYYNYKNASEIPVNQIYSVIDLGAIGCSIPYTNYVKPEDIINELVDNLENGTMVNIGTNIFYPKYMSIYKQIFSRTNLLSDEVFKYQKIIGFNYITVSFRFMGRLGDFDEPGITELSIDQQLDIMTKTKHELLTFIHSLDINKRKVLVLSDSSKFLNFIREIPSIFVFPGDIQHMVSIKNDSESERAFKKTIVDFNLILDAEEAHLFVSDYLYRSGFPYLASLCANIPFIVHTIS